MPDPSNLKKQFDYAFRDFEVDGVPSSGEHEPVKQEVRTAGGGIIDLAAEARDIAATAGTTIVMGTRAQLNALPGPFSIGDRAEVRNDPAGNVPNGNGVYRWSGAAWAWIDNIIPAGVQDSITQRAVSETTAITDQRIGEVRQEVADLVRPFRGAYLSLGDVAGFERRFLTPELFDLPCDDILTNNFAFLGAGADFSVADTWGYFGFSVGAGGVALPGYLDSRQVTIFDDPSTYLCVRDANGFAPVHVPRGRSLGPTDQLEKDVRELQEGGGGGRAWPKIQRAGVLVSAHRGVHEGTAAPENSIDALRLAARMGYPVSETDMVVTGDGNFVIMHDDTINRTMRNAADYSVIAAPVVVSTTPLATLRAGYVLASPDPAMRRPIPTLGEYVREAKALGLKPIMEIKGPGWTDPLIKSAVEACVEALGWDGVVFTGFIAAHLDYIRTLNPDVALYYILPFSTANIDHVAAKAGVINSDVSQVSEALVSHAHLKGVRVACWTASPSDFDRLVAAGIDEATTNMVAPRLDDQAIAWSTQSGPDWTGWVTTGAGTGGEIVLAEGQTLKLDVSEIPPVDLGAWYMALEYSGSVRVSGPGVAQTEDRVHPFGASRCYQSRMSGLPIVTVTAGLGGATIKTAAVAVAVF